jgi:hypothetical protein
LEALFGAAQGGLVPPLDNICLHLPTIGGWIHNAALALAVAGVIVTRVQTQVLDTAVKTGRN